MKTSLLILALATLFIGGCQQPSDTGTPAPSGSDGNVASGNNAPTDPASNPTNTEPAATEPAKEQSVPIADRKPAEGEEVAVLETGKGRIILMFFPDKAPKHVERFKMLANKKFYDGTRFHRCIAGFMIQGGDPNSKDVSKAAMWGTGGYTENGIEVNVPAEFNEIQHVPGILSAARSNDPNSANSQFFLVQGDAKFLDGKYTAYGKVVSGQDVIDAIVVTGDANNNGAVKPAEAVVVKSVSIKKWPVK